MVEEQFDVLIDNLSSLIEHVQLWTLFIAGGNNLLFSQTIFNLCLTYTIFGLNLVYKNFIPISFVFFYYTEFNKGFFSKVL